MTATISPLKKAGRKNVYRWPVDPARYDRTPSLSEDERAALATLVERWGRGLPQREPESRQALERLLVPLREALAVEGAQGGRWKQQITLPFMIRAMHEQGSSFWAWTPAQWVEVIKSDRRNHNNARINTAAVGILLCSLDVLDFAPVRFTRRFLAHRVFGEAIYEESEQRFRAVLLEWGYANTSLMLRRLEVGLAPALLRNRSPYLDDLTLDVLHSLRVDPRATHAIASAQQRLSRVLAHLGIVPAVLKRHTEPLPFQRDDPVPGVAPGWVEAARRWRDTSTYEYFTGRYVCANLMKTGRWLFKTHPEVTRPDQWTTELAAEFIAMVCHSKVGEWAGRTDQIRPEKIGKPLTPRGKVSWISSTRAFFRDVRKWKWYTLQIDPTLDLASPRSVTGLIGPKPRDIKPSVWVKLVWASLNLTDDDLPVGGLGRGLTYPLAMVRAMAVVWTHSGLRANEIARLRVGCTRRLDKGTLDDDGTDLSEYVCYLHVPVNKTSTEFVKPVGLAVARLIDEWESVRPNQPAQIDNKTGEAVHYLFSFRCIRVAVPYFTNSLIPMLCKKAGVPLEDVPGQPITSHRGRASAATWYYNTREGMTLYELQEWLGHKQPESTQHYVAITPLKRAQSFARAHKNANYIEVLLDLRAIESGEAAHGRMWRFVPLGDGDYCGNPEWVTCKHRMACAGCDFYVPAESSVARRISTQERLQKYLEEIPNLDAEERAALEGDIEKQKALVARLRKVPTPSGQTPEELSSPTSNMRGRSLPVLNIPKIK